MKKAVSSPHVHEPFGPYSTAIEKNGVLYVSGQGPFDRNKRLVGDEILTQTRQTLENLLHLLQDNGYRLDDVVKVTVYLQEIADWGAFNAEYETVFANEPRPARTVVSCKLNGMLVELDCIAAK